MLPINNFCLVRQAFWNALTCVVTLCLLMLLDPFEILITIQPAIMGRWVLGQSKVIDRIYFQTETSRNCSIDENEIKKNTQLNK